MIIAGPRAHIISASRLNIVRLRFSTGHYRVRVTIQERWSRAPVVSRAPTIIDLPSAEIVSPRLGPTPAIIDTTLRVRCIRDGSPRDRTTSGYFLRVAALFPTFSTLDDYNRDHKGITGGRRGIFLWIFRDTSWFSYWLFWPNVEFFSFLFSRSTNFYFNVKLEKV